MNTGLCHFERSEERAHPRVGEWRNLAVKSKRQDFSTTKFVETNFSATHELEDSDVILNEARNERNEESPEVSTYFVVSWRILQSQAPSDTVSQISCQVAIFIDGRMWHTSGHISGEY